MTYEDVLYDLMQQDDRFIVMTAENRAAIRHLPQKLNGRFIDVGIAEQTMIGMAAGLALRGRIPIVHALACFLTMRAFEFIRTDVGIANLPVKLVGGVPGFLSDANGPTHQALEDVALMRGIPPMDIFCPADEQDMLLGLPAVLKSERPFYIRFNNLPPVVNHQTYFEIGRAEQIADGKDVTILVYGALFAQAYEARQILHAKGISARLLNLRTVKPLDETAVLKAAQETNLLITVEDHFRTGGLYSIVSELLIGHGVSAPVLSIALEDRWFTPALLPAVLAHEGFTGPQIAERIQDRWWSIENAYLNKRYRSFCF